MIRIDRKATFLFFTAAAALGLLSAESISAGRGAASHTRHTVVIRGMQFDPSDLDLRVGDTVVWINRDPFPHTATATDGLFDSHEIAAGGSWEYTLRKTGVVPYACSLHPTMKATLRVQGKRPGMSS